MFTAYTPEGKNIKFKHNSGGLKVVTYVELSKTDSGIVAVQRVREKIRVYQARGVKVKTGT